MPKGVGVPTRGQPQGANKRGAQGQLLTEYWESPCAKSPGDKMLRAPRGFQGAGLLNKRPPGPSRAVAQRHRYRGGHCPHHRRPRRRASANSTCAGADGPTPSALTAAFAVALSAAFASPRLQRLGLGALGEEFGIGARA
eukprot:CAMPEP_0170395498 /NCGR_PEP_ID=MMETSP0117_2-20130122/21808_1 /TAXON_ID=400756 /ORGANISM="Durinskia baltica, Strain CSIRO CS-38" /LENGTH=139 /DNA_ID=CAMNT_0010651807 /DNA_START=94 /DNA_END=513 /DNA_ORIENTATION=-